MCVGGSGTAAAAGSGRRGLKRQAKKRKRAPPPWRKGEREDGDGHGEGGAEGCRRMQKDGWSTVREMREAAGRRHTEVAMATVRFVPCWELGRDVWSGEGAVSL